MQEPNLFEVRCPFQRLSKTEGKLYPCNSVCAKITAGSSGEFRCRKCRLLFWTEIDSRGRYHTRVEVKQIENKSTEE